MANLGLRELFGNDVYTDIDPVGGSYEVTIDLRNFVDTDNQAHSNGQILNGLGLSSLDSTASFMTEDTPNESSLAYKIFYALLLLIQQNQAANINDDPTQKIFISEQRAAIGVGSRSGQIQRSFSVSFFTEAGITSTSDIDDL